MCKKKSGRPESLPVALLAEGVDRNRAVAQRPQHHTVALLAEGVDRNSQVLCRLLPKRASPSSRRAWIEIGQAPARPDRAFVALLAEGVDRNFLLR